MRVRLHLELGAVASANEDLKKAQDVDPHHPVVIQLRQAILREVVELRTSADLVGWGVMKGDFKVGLCISGSMSRSSIIT